MVHDAAVANRHDQVSRAFFPQRANKNDKAGGKKSELSRHRAKRHSPVPFIIRSSVMAALALGASRWSLVGLIGRAAAPEGGELACWPLDCDVA